MPPPDAAPLEALSPAELHGLVGDLIAEVNRLRAENRALRDEVARLKGLPPRPPSRPSGMEEATGGAGAGKGGQRSRRRRGAGARQRRKAPPLATAQARDRPKNVLPTPREA